MTTFHLNKAVAALIFALLFLPLAAAGAPLPAPVSAASQAQPDAPEAPTGPAASQRPLELLGHAGPYSALAVSGEILYAGYGAGLAIFDLSIPDQPARIGLVALYDPIRALAVADGFVYTAYENYVQVVDARAPAHPRLIARFGIPQKYVMDLHISAGLEIYDSSQPLSPTLIYTMTGFFPNLRVVSDTLYLLREDMLSTYHISPSSQPQLLDSLPLRPGYEMVIDHGIAYIMTYSETLLLDTALAIIDVRDPTNLAPLSTLPIDARLALAASNGYIYIIGPIAINDDGLTIVDARDPRKPQIVRRYSMCFWLGCFPNYEIEVAGTTLYIIDSNGLKIVDANDPRSIHTLWSAYAPGLSDVEVVDGRIYTTSLQRGLSILQFSPDRIRHLFLSTVRR